MVAESIYELLSSWFTPPTLLFLLLNFTIATIYLTSTSSHKSPSLPSSPSSHLKPNSTEDLHRTTSVLQRLKSVNFYHFANYHTSPVAQQLMTTELEPEEIEIEPVVYQSNEKDGKKSDANLSAEAEHLFDNEDETGGEKSLDEVYSQLQRGSHNRSKSDMEPASGAVAVKLVKKMKKSASSKSAFRNFKEEEILEARRPATVKEATEKAEDEEVDLKADDFINKFKQQLHLQRLDSILRYKEMLGRGAHK